MYKSKILKAVQRPTTTNTTNKTQINNDFIKHICSGSVIE